MLNYNNFKKDKKTGLLIGKSFDLKLFFMYGVKHF